MGNEEAVLSPRRHLAESHCGMVGMRAEAFLGEEAGQTLKVGAKVAYHGRWWRVHAASAFPLARRYEAVFG